MGEQTKFTTRCGAWTFEAVEAYVGNYPFPTNDRDIEGANAHPACVEVTHRGDTFGSPMHIYVRDGDGDTCLEIARTLAGATGRLDREASLNKGLDAVVDGREAGDFRVFLPVTMDDWFRLLKDRWYGDSAFLGA